MNILKTLAGTVLAVALLLIPALAHPGRGSSRGSDRGYSGSRGGYRGTQPVYRREPEGYGYFGGHQSRWAGTRYLYWSNVDGGICYYWNGYEWVQLLLGVPYCPTDI